MLNYRPDWRRRIARPLKGRRGDQDRSIRVRLVTDDDDDDDDWFFVEFHLTNLHKMVLSVFDFPENRRRESPTFLMGVSVITYRI